MNVMLLAVADCPNLPLLEERLGQVLAGRSDVRVDRQVISDPDAAVRAGMHGSPTILINGVDPFATADVEPGMSCRLYAGLDGRVDGAPSVSELRSALAEPTGANAVPWPAVLGRAGLSRIAPAEGGLRAVHQAVLRSFAGNGQAPSPASLADAARPFDASQVLAQLAEGDFLCIDDAGRITAAYPFSGVETPHRVQVSGGAAVYAMCAVDALGMAMMLGSDVVIESADPWSGAPVTVSVRATGSSSWRPVTAVVFDGRLAHDCCGPSASVCCGYMNFFASRGSARKWAAAHPEITGTILSKSRALKLGQQIFGQLLG